MGYKLGYYRLARLVSIGIYDNILGYEGGPKHQFAHCLDIVHMISSKNNCLLMTKNLKDGTWARGKHCAMMFQ